MEIDENESLIDGSGGRTTAQDSRLECECCERTFACVAKRKQHERSKRNERPFQCDYSGCFAAFSRSDFLKRHKFESHLKHIHKFKCESCSIIFPSNEKLLRHFDTKLCLSRRKVSDKTTALAKTAPSCSATDSQEAAATDSQVITINPEPKVWTCGICLKEFRSSSSFSKHRRIHQALPIERATYKCSNYGCERVYTRASNLRAHVRAAHEKPQWQCQTCFHYFAYKQSFERHQCRFGDSVGKASRKEPRHMSTKKKRLSLEKTLVDGNVDSSYSEELNRVLGRRPR
uniref:C2H2-type domain-containing protein n=1 Tax=Timspurckia oligopyrenoides TaxID=708627 RepID=A0A7S0ZKP4_9RHOD|mmetsp:Transcript_9087/g.16353  ORF Transcript_9087/g.16353 Transcript_9087/m.16353 type:complete len:288 (+) Transcript_9087:22-885(+)